LGVVAAIGGAVKFIFVASEFMVKTLKSKKKIVVTTPPDINIFVLY